MKQIITFFLIFHLNSLSGKLGEKFNEAVVYKTQQFPRLAVFECN